MDDIQKIIDANPELKDPNKVPKPVLIPGQGKLVRFVNDQGKVVKEQYLNRKERRRLKKAQ